MKRVTRSLLKVVANDTLRESNITVFSNSSKLSELQSSCRERGLNPGKLKKVELIDLLNKFEDGIQDLKEEVPSKKPKKSTKTDKENVNLSKPKDSKKEKVPSSSNSLKEEVKKPKKSNKTHKEKVNISKIEIVTSSINSLEDKVPQKKPKKSTKTDKENETFKKPKKSKKLNIPTSSTVTPLLSLGRLYSGTLLRRPSQHNKSPYVADVALDSEQGMVTDFNMADTDTNLDNEEVIAHAPMLDLGGLLLPGAKVLMTKSKPGGKTSHAIQLVLADKGEWVGANPALGNKVARALLDQGLVTEAIFGEVNKQPLEIQSEVTMTKKSESEETVRADFVVNGAVVEVKTCVNSDFCKNSAPEPSKKDRFHTVVSTAEPQDYVRTALFPIGKKGQEFEGEKVVSSRCIKHLRHLAQLAEGSKVGCLLVVVNRGDCHRLRPCKEACPVFAREFEKAVEAGVRVVAAAVRWDSRGDCYFGGIVPVVMN